MEDDVYRILKIKALERWENEGGRISDDRVKVKASGKSTASGSTSAPERHFEAKSMAAGA